MRQIKKMLLLKLGLEQVDWRQVYLLQIFLKCMKKLVIKKNGLLELISISRSEAGGLKEVIASIKGN